MKDFFDIMAFSLFTSLSHMQHREGQAGGGKMSEICKIGEMKIKTLKRKFHTKKLF